MKDPALIEYISMLTLLSGIILIIALLYIYTGSSKSIRRLRVNKLKPIMLFIFGSIVVISGVLFYNFFTRQISHSFEINNFDKDIIITDTLKPKENNKYLAHSVSIEGDVNDTVVFKLCKECTEEKVVGKIEMEVVRDYDNATNQVLYIKIKGNKNTKGKLKIQHKIL